MMPRDKLLIILDEFVLIIDPPNFRVTLALGEGGDEVLPKTRVSDVGDGVNKGGIFPGSQGARLPQNLQAPTKCWQ